MRVVLIGGSGHLGRLLSRRFEDVVVVSRSSGIRWDGKTLGPWAESLDGADVVINLAGRSVNCRYNAANRQEILESRVESTRIIGEAIARARRIEFSAMAMEHSGCSTAWARRRRTCSPH